MRKFLFVLIAAAVLPSAGCRSAFESVVSVETQKNNWIREHVYGGGRRHEASECMYGGQFQDVQYGGEMIGGDGMMVGEPIITDGAMISGGNPGCQSCGH